MLGFIIASCIWNENHLSSLRRCVESIRKFHPLCPIIVVLDNSSRIEFPEENLLRVVKYGVNVAADMLTYRCFLESEFDIAVILQDSMALLQPVDVDYKSVKYLWYFTNHRLQWSVIEEPQTDENIQNKIRVHDDLILYCIDNYTRGDFQRYAKEMLYNKEAWIGCFGCLTIMRKSFLQIMDEKTSIIHTMEKMGTNNRHRRAIESIFSLAVQYTYGKVCDVYDGLYYDGMQGGHGLRGEKIEKVSWCRDPIERSV